MTGFSVPKAAFAGYGLLGRLFLPALVWWAVFYAWLVGRGVMAAAMAGEAFRAMTEMQGSGQVDMSSMMAVMAETNVYTAVSTPISLVVTAVLLSAVLRGILRPVDKGIIAHISIGPQELKFAVTMIVVAIITGVAALVVAVLGLIVTAIVGLSGGGGPVAGIVALLTAVLAISAFLFFQVKFLLAQPQTAHQKAIRIFESWKLTKGRFWPLLASIFLMLIGLLPFVAIFGGATVAVGLNMEGLTFAGPEDIRGMTNFLTTPAFTVADNLTPARLISAGAMAALWVVMVVFGLGTAASAYLQITGEAPVTTKTDAAAAVDDDDDEDWDED